ncbi:hypothetical protein [Kitasatospora sp. NPDC056273]|uniref:type I-G CRISPR-associated protein, Cas3-extension family n=1 Tax=Kitasatospora sp. NPDC056273 TaxID=3345769 RepID=UPI0035D7E7B4
MHQLELPALRSDDPLGFLAALGVLELTTAVLPAKPRLHWKGPAGAAVLSTAHPLTLDTLTELLTSHLPPKPAQRSKKKVNGEEPENPAAAVDPLPHAPGLLTIPRDDDPTARNDALRMLLDANHDLLRQLARAEREDGNHLARWLAALTNSMCFQEFTPDSKTGGSGNTVVRRTRTTPLIATSGRMTLAIVMQKAVEGCHQDPLQIRSALTGWRRIPEYAPANLDHRALGDAHTNPEGEAYQRGAPGPTWLALHALGAFRLTAIGRTEAATSWDIAEGGALRWPAWTPPLTTTAVTVLLEHPAVRAPEPATPRNGRMLTDLGVTALYAAPRTGTSKYASPLGAGRPLWP